MAEEVKATPAARTRAEEAGLDLAEIEGTGTDGQVTAQDVDKALAEIRDAEEAASVAAGEAAEAEERGRKRVLLKLNPQLVEEGTSTAVVAGRTFPSRRPVTRAEFERDFKPARDTGGRQVLHIDKEVG